MHYGNIKYTDIANGEGIRTTLFVSGCTHHCKNCFNPETWDFCYGKEYTAEVEDEIIKSLEPSYVKGITFLGGEPMEPNNQKTLVNLAKKVRETYGNSKNIWCYTGCLLWSCSIYMDYARRHLYGCHARLHRRSHIATQWWQEPPRDYR